MRKPRLRFHQEPTIWKSFVQFFLDLPWLKLTRHTIQTTHARPQAGMQKKSRFALSPWFGIQKFDPYRARCMIRNQNVARHSTPSEKKQVIPCNT